MKNFKVFVLFMVVQIATLLFVWIAQSYYESFSPDYWLHYKKVVPQKEIFGYGEFAKFDSTTKSFRPADYTYKEVLLCDTYDGKGFQHQFTRLIPGSNHDGNGNIKQRQNVDSEGYSTGGWTYGEFPLPNQDANCLVTSRFCIQTPFWGDTCEDLIMSTFLVRDI